jgi:hypothetical protein
MIKIEDYIFNFEKLFLIQNETDKQFIIDIFHKLLNDGISTPKIYEFFLNTLYCGGFLINKTQFDREKVFKALDV